MSDQIEQWKSIKGYEGIYEVSNTGFIRSITDRHNWKSHVHNADGWQIGN